MNKMYFLILFGFSIFIIYASDPVLIIRKIDQNEVYNSIRYEGEMVIFLSGKKYVKTFKAYAKGAKNSFIEFTNPDDAGTKYLKKDGNLYVYSPDTESVIPITGHMLKESMMGSDMSYEDTINNETLESRYTPKIIGEENYEGKDCFIVELVAKRKTESYSKQILWVDKQNYSVYKVELFALSGAKIKEIKNNNFQKINNKLFPVEIEVRDLLRKNSKTIFTMKKIEMDIDIPDSMFSLKLLEK